MSQEMPARSHTLTDLARLQEIADLDLASDEVDVLLQKLAREAAEHFDLPVGLVSIVLDDAQYFAAMHGLDGWLASTRGTPVEWSFCRFAVETREPFVVENAEAHPWVRESPLVQMDGVRCYAGIPLISSRGHAIGSFCVIGPQARHFSQQDLDDLHRFARAAVHRIESRRRSSGPQPKR